MLPSAVSSVIWDEANVYVKGGETIKSFSLFFKEDQMSQANQTVPTQAWVTVFSGTAINLCLGILYAWSIWKTALVNVDKAVVAKVKALIPVSGQSPAWAAIPLISISNLLAAGAPTTTWLLPVESRA